MLMWMLEERGVYIDFDLYTLFFRSVSNVSVALGLKWCLEPICSFLNRPVLGEEEEEGLRLVRASALPYT